MLEQGVQYSASDFIELKKKIKEEMLRRCHTGSLAAYGGSEYDFVETPQVGGRLTVDQANKVIIPMNAITDSGFTAQEVGQQAKAMGRLYDKIVEYASAPLEGEGHFCNASCSGLCYTECSGSCSIDCSGECGGNCTTSCGNNCTGSCVGECGGNCSSACADNCENSCLGDCSGTCGGCGGYCGGSCGGCADSCLGGCSGDGSGDCGGDCTALNQSELMSVSLDEF
jgi:hypothetical protein